MATSPSVTAVKSGAVVPVSGMVTLGGSPGGAASGARQADGADCAPNMAKGKTLLARAVSKRVMRPPSNSFSASSDASDQLALDALALELKGELNALKAGVPGACRRFEDAAARSVEHLASSGMPAERVLACVKQMIYGHVPWEPFRDPSHMDRLAVPIITACIATCFAERG
jgi:hypothetical protein